jgi:hypothetical protein
MMHGPINVKSPNNSKWQMGFNSAFKGLMGYFYSRKRRADIRNISMAVNTGLIPKHYFISNFVDALQESAQ